MNTSKQNKFDPGIEGQLHTTWPLQEEIETGTQVIKKVKTFYSRLEKQRNFRKKILAQWKLQKILAPGVPAKFVEKL